MATATTPSPTKTKPEYAQLLKTLFSRVPGGLWLELRRIPQGGGRPAQRFVRVRKLSLLRVREQEGKHQYFGVLPRREKGNGRREGVALGTALWLDLDGAPLDPGWWGLPAPTAVVRSSGGKFQAYWLLETPTNDLTRLEECNARLSALASGDPAVWDAARVLRLPGFVNYKYPERPVAKLKELDATRVYDLAALEALLPDLQEPRSTEEQERYANLWLQGYGIALRPGDAFYYCPWHGSRSGGDDLHIDSKACVHHCFGCQEGGGLETLEAIAEGWADSTDRVPGEDGQAVGSAPGESDSPFLYRDPGIQQSGISSKDLNHWRLLWEEREGLFALEGHWGSIADTQAACLTHNKVVYEDDLHKTAGKAPCPDPFHPGHQPRAMYHLRESEDRKQGYPGLPETLAIYRVSKTLTLEEAARDYRPRFEELKAETRRTTGRVRNPAELRAQAIDELPLSRVMESSLPNAISRFRKKAEQQGKRLYQWRKFVEYRGGDRVAIEEYILGDAGVGWGRMKGIELITERDKWRVISVFADPSGLGQGGWSRSGWPEALAKAVVEALESHDGQKGRTQAAWFPGMKKLVAPPPKSPCPECGGQKILIGPVQHYHVLEGPIESDVTGGYYYRVVDTRKRRRVLAWMRTQDMDLAAD